MNYEDVVVADNNIFRSGPNNRLTRVQYAFVLKWTAWPWSSLILHREHYSGGGPLQSGPASPTRQRNNTYGHYLALFPLPSSDENLKWPLIRATFPIG